VAAKLRDEHDASSIVFVDDGKEKSLPVCEKTVFNAHLSLTNYKVKSAQEAGSDEEQEQVNRATLTLYHCSDDDGTYKVTEVKSGPLEQNDLRSEVGPYLNPIFSC
jgi:villin 1/advillin